MSRALETSGSYNKRSNVCIIEFLKKEKSGKGWRKRVECHNDCKNVHFGEIYKPIDMKSWINPSQENWKEVYTKAHHNQISKS